MVLSVIGLAVGTSVGTSVTGFAVGFLVGISVAGFSLESNDAYM